MSTNSGRKGWCDYCPHQRVGHTKHKYAKCKKCDKAFEICQVGLHGSSNTNRGYRICYKPCNCGESYYPDPARAATMLARDEYHIDHELFKPLSNDEEEQEEEKQDKGEEEEEEGGDEEDEEENEEEEEDKETGTTREDKRKGKESDSGSSEDPLQWSDAKFQARTRSDLVRGKTRKDKGKGKESVREEASHKRVDSGGSEDPLQWSEAQFQARTHTPADLVQGFAQVNIDPWSAWEWNKTYDRWSRYSYLSDGSIQYQYQEGEMSDWRWSDEWSSWERYGIAPDGQVKYDYDAGEGKEEEGHSSKKGKGKGKGKGKEKRK